METKAVYKVNPGGWEQAALFDMAPYNKTNWSGFMNTAFLDSLRADQDDKGPQYIQPRLIPDEKDGVDQPELFDTTPYVDPTYFRDYDCFREFQEIIRIRKLSSGGK
jgi:hypothetical protein